MISADVIANVAAVSVQVGARGDDRIARPLDAAPRRAGCPLRLLACRRDAVPCASVDSAPRPSACRKPRDGGRRRRNGRLQRSRGIDSVQVSGSHPSSC